MELFRDNGANGPGDLVEASVAWDGVTHPHDPEALLRACAQNGLGTDYDDAYFFAVMMHDAWAMEPEVMRLQGLLYCFGESSVTQGSVKPKHLVEVSADGIVSTKRGPPSWKPLHEFIIANEEYVAALVELIDRKITTLA
ncbi:MAG: hypothetical protein QM723_13245 [Myxococcaceae bacterium]